MIGFTCPKDRHLSHAVSMRYVILDEHATQPISRCGGIDVSIAVVRTNFSDYRDLTFLTQIFR